MFEETEAFLRGDPGSGSLRPRTRSGLFPETEAFLEPDAAPPPPAEESFISRAAKGLMGGVEAIGHAVSTPARGLGMLATAAQEQLQFPEYDIGAAPGSRLRVSPEGVGSSPDLASLELEGLGMPFESRKRDLATAGGVVPREQDPVMEALRTGRASGSRAFAVAEPVARTALGFVSDPALAGLGKLGALAGEGRLTEAGLSPGFGSAIEAAGPAAGIIPDADLAAAAGRAVTAGRIAGGVEKGIAASFVPGMVEGAYRGGREFLRAGREEGYTSPAALHAGAEGIIDAAMAAMIGGSAFHPAGAGAIDPQTGQAIAAASALDAGVREQSRFETGERDFLTPDFASGGIAEAARARREGLQETKSVAQEQIDAAMDAMTNPPPVWTGAEGEAGGPGAFRTPQEVAADQLHEAGLPDVWGGPGEPPAPPDAGTPAVGAPLEGIAAAAARTAPGRDEITTPESEGVIPPAQPPPEAPHNDILINEARALVASGETPSTSLFQHHFKIGFSKAENLVNRLKAETPPPPAVLEPESGAPAPAPTPPQQEAGNYEKGHLRWHGLQVSVETAKGGERVAADGSWRVPDYPADYGYIRKTEGADGDQVDVFMGDHPAASHVYVIDQIDPDTGKFDEHKSMVGFGSEKEALDTYHRAYTDGRTQERIGAVTTMTPDEFKAWVQKGDTKKPLSFNERESAGRDIGEQRPAPVVESAREDVTPEPRPGPKGTTGAEPAAGAGVQPRVGERRLAEVPVTVEQRQGERRAEIAKRLKLPEEHPAVTEVMGARAEARTDPLTGLGNKVHWTEIQKTVDRAKDHVGVLDLKRFKPINDKYGHEAGDTVLKHVATMIRKHFGEDAARFGGDEFGFLLRDLPLEEARAKAEAFRTDLATHKVTLRGADGHEVDIPGVEAHLGIGRNALEADTAANVEAAPSRVGGRGSEHPPERGAEPRVGALPEPRVQGGGAGAGEAPKPEGSRAAEAPVAAAPEKKPVTPQLAEVPGGGTKYTLPSFVTEPFKKPRSKAEAQRESEDAHARARETLTKEYKGLKAALTRAENTKDPAKILAEAERGLKRFEEIGESPDDWSRWERAKDDAEYALKRAGDGGFKAPELAFDLGQEAFAAGKKRIAPTDLVVRGQADYWYEGWDKANLAAPVPETPPKKAPTEITVAFKEKPSKAVRDRLKGGGFRWSASRGVWSAKPSEISRGVAEVMRIHQDGKVTGLEGEAPPKLVEPSPGMRAAADELTGRKPSMMEKAPPGGWRPEDKVPRKVSPNTIFTEDAATKARERLRAKFRTQVVSGLDPEMLQDGITLAGYHVEKGARTFAAFSKAMVEDLGEAVRPHLKSWYMALKYDPRSEGFAKEMDEGFEKEAAPKILAPRALADDVFKLLDKGESIKDNKALDALAQEVFGGTRGEGKYTPRDAYDAMEAGVNRWIEKNGPRLLKMEPKDALAELRGLLKRLPTQTDRTREQVEFQQFSTPPTQAFVAAQALGIRPEDVVLEPSAGVGGLAAWAKAAGAKEVLVNEIAPRRVGLLKALGFEPTSFDAEHLNDVLPEDVKPTAILMNPPFSATGGRVQAHKTAYGARHVEQALERLEPGGRLVAIVGEGMKFHEVGTEPPRVREATGSSFTDWWAKTMEKYNVRANLGIPGDEYGKYGTTFGNQIIVIDKTGPTPGESFAERLRNVVRGRKVSLEDALAAIRPIADDREAPQPRAEGVAAEPSRPVAPDRAGLEREPRGQAGVGVGDVRPGAGRPGVPGGEPGGAPATVPEGEPGARPSESAKPLRAGGGRAPDVVAGEPSLETPGPLDTPAAREGHAERETEEGGTFVQYVPAKLDTKDLAKHPANIVESASMAAVDPPDITYRSSLPPEVTKEGRLSDLQYETVLYSGQRHAQTLPDGKRAGYFIGDGTGVGKGREIAGIVLDNWHQGRKRTVWFSHSRDLMADATRDLEGVAGKGKIPIASINDYPMSGEIEHPNGVVFSTYQSLISKPQGQKAAEGARLEQLKRWLGKDGIIVFDEAHKAKNALGQGRGEPTQTGLAVIKIQDEIPGARVVYVSATGATDVRNMAYMTRLGLWAPERKPVAIGEFRPEVSAKEQAAADQFAFPGGFNEFLNEVEGGGVGAKEMVSRDLKALGMYNSRSISFKGVEYREKIHTLTPEQRGMYDAAAKAWQVILQNIDKAIGVTHGGPRARTAAMKRFWNDHQRFFRQVTTAMKMPTVIAEVEDALKGGESAIVTIKGTAESKTAEQVSKAGAEGKGLEELDFTPRETITQMVDKAFPTTLYEEVPNPADPTKTVIVPVVRNGVVVESKEALAMKKKIMDELSDLNLPENPLDQFVNHFGVKNVAEMTGRKKRLIRDPKTGKVTYENRAGDGVAADKVNLYENQQFQSGKKRIAIISRAASTGISLHSSLQEKNQQRRRQIAAELDWSADAEMQTFGRSHRSDQKVPPIYVLVSTDVGGEKRFSSTIARRLASLGALTKGQRDATGGGDLAKYNFETPEGEAALSSLYDAMEAGKYGRYGTKPIEGLEDGRQTIKDMGLARDPQAPRVEPQDKRDVPRFLNRVLALDVERQNVILADFVKRFGVAVEQAKESGTFDEGVADLKADSIKVKGEPTLIHKDPTTGAETRHYTIDAEEKIDRLPFKDATSWVGKDEGSGFARQVRSGRLVAFKTGGIKTDAITGATKQQMILRGPRGSYESVSTADFGDKYKATTEDVAKDWNDALGKLPKTEQVEHHVIAGSVLPIWQKLKGEEGERLHIMRAQTDAGQRVVGVEIPKNEVGRVLQSLGIGRTLETPDQVFTAVLDQGDTVGLSERLSLRRSRVHGEPRIEVTGIKSSRFDQLRAMGLIEERIDYQSRFFVPTDAETGKPILEKLMKAYPPVGAAEGAGAAALQRLKDRATDGNAYSMGAVAGEGAAAWKDASIYGASLIHQGIRQFAEWSKRMVSDLGETISDLGTHLRNLFDQSTRRAAATAPPPAPPKPPVGSAATPPAPAGGGKVPISEALLKDAVTASNRAHRIADTFEATNRKLEIAMEGADRIQERGTIEKGARPEFRGEGQPAREQTEHFRFSESDIERAGQELVAAVKEFQDYDRGFRESADPNSAQAMRVSRQIMEQAVKNWQVYRTSAGRAVQRFNRPIPRDVIDRLREAGLIAGNLRDVKARAPIASNILDSLQHWDTLSSAGKKQFAKDVVDHFRLNLFSVTSWTLDMIGNASELTGQAGAGLGHDLVRVVKGDPTFPSLQGAFRAIRANPALRELSPDIEHALETTVGGERLRKEEGAGIFTYRKGIGSKIYDYGVGAPLYWKGFMDTAAKRMGALWTLNRDAIEGARAKGLQGADREAFIKDFLVNPPAESLARALSNGKKAGFNRDLSKLEESVASSTTARLLVDVFARWPFQFARWGAEMLGYNPEMYHKLRAGTLRAEDVGEYLGKAAVGVGGLMLLNNYYNRTDFNSMEYVDEDGNRIRLSNRDPIPTGLWLLAVLKGAYAAATGDKKGRAEALAKATAALQFASVPGARLLAGQGGLLGGTIKVFLQALENPQNDPRALRRELEDTINRAIPGQALLSALKTAFDPTIREGIGANLPIVSAALPAAVNPVTGEPLQPRQRVGGLDLPSIGGTPIPGATRLLDPVQKLLSRFGLLVYRGPRSPIAGYPPGQVPEELRTEWQGLFGHFRNRLLEPLTRLAGVENLDDRTQEAIRKKVQDRDRAAAEMANREMRRRHGGPKKLPRQGSRRELAGPDVFQEGDRRS